MQLKPQLKASLRAGAVLLALTGMVASKGLPAQAKSATATFHAKISKKQASRTVLARYPGKVVGKIALENEEGKMQYAVNVRSGKVLREVMVDATTGAIVDVEVTDTAKESAENKAEAMGQKAGMKAEAKENGEAGEKGKAGENGKAGEKGTK